jgi:hypothetical protein
MSNLSHQFDGQKAAWEDIQRRRYARKQGVSGFIGNGYWFLNYPNMVGGIGSGTIIQSQTGEDKKDLGQNLGVGAENLDAMAGNSTGMGEGGTAVTGDTGGAVA